MTHPLRRLPRDLPRSARTAYIAALALTDVDDEVRWRMVPGGVDALHNALGHDHRRSTERAVAQGLLWKILWKDRRGDLYVDAEFTLVVETAAKTSRFGGRFCGACGHRSLQRWCPGCKQGKREDRAWQSVVYDMLIHQKATTGRLNMLDMHRKTGASLWRELDVNDQPVHGGGSSIALFLLRECSELLSADEIVVIKTGLREATGEDRIHFDGSKAQRARARSA